MELSRTISLFPQVSCFIMLTVAAAVALPPSLPSQTPKELIGEACFNELQHRERETLWSYTAERHNHDHVFREQVIETVDGPVRHLLAVDGHPPTSAQTKEEDDRHQELLKNPSGLRAIQKLRDDDDKTMQELLRVIPDAFIFEDQGKEGESERIAFHPNRGFKPKTYEQRVLHALEGLSGNTRGIWVWSDRPRKPRRYHGDYPRSSVAGGLENQPGKNRYRRTIRNAQNNKQASR
jgi:hypothetical protein